MSSSQDQTAGAPPPAQSQASQAGDAVGRQQEWRKRKNFQSRDSSQSQRPRHQNQHQQSKGKKTRKRERAMKAGSADEVLLLDVQEMVAKLQAAQEGSEAASEEILPEQGSEIEVDVQSLSSTGEALALAPGSNRIYVLSFAVPGDRVKVKVYRHMDKEQYTVADFISVVKPSPMRDDSRIQCQYFATCSGCQFQMLDYADQLRHKKTIVEKAFRNFSQLAPEVVPGVLDTIGSPLQYGYRTKLTPHFDAPQGWRKTNETFKSRPPIGFMPKGKRDTLDIEDCPIGTDAVRLGMKRERARMDVEFNKYSRGATILLRESTERIPKGPDAPARPPTPTDAVKVETDSYTDLKTCVSDNNGQSTEYIDDFVFHNPAGTFFQNNNSILSPFTDYIRQHILPKSNPEQIKYLIDAYSGSGLFTITLSSLFKGSTGIDISDGSITFARKNAEANGIPTSECSFIAADARELFKTVSYDRDETVVVLDPPRKGCDADFLSQLLRFGPRRVIYVSCNVHTQARDVGMLVRGEVDAEAMGERRGDGKEQTEAKAAETKIRYDIESIRGFDFFPQTGHVEGVAVLNRVEVP